MMTRRFVGLHVSDLGRFRLLDVISGKVYIPNPELARDPDLPFEERWLEAPPRPPHVPPKPAVKIP